MSGSSSTTTFNGKACNKHKPKLPPPFSIRFTDDERARLNRDAGKKALSAYIRERLFGDDVTERKPRYVRKQRNLKADAKDLARMLAAFGQSELATSMMAIALAAQSGALPVMPELCERLDQACDDIRNMRADLIEALGVKSQ